MRNHSLDAGCSAALISTAAAKKHGHRTWTTFLILPQLPKSGLQRSSQTTLAVYNKHLVLASDWDKCGGAIACLGCPLLGRCCACHPAHRPVAGVRVLTAMCWAVKRLHLPSSLEPLVSGSAACNWHGTTGAGPQPPGPTQLRINLIHNLQVHVPLRRHTPALDRASPPLHYLLQHQHVR